AIIVPLLKVFSAKRVAEIKRAYPFDEADIPADKKKHFNSVNDDDCIKYIQELDPDIVIVNGTRIISSKVLQCTNAVFINMHTGITPIYRGVHGGYWALINNDRENCGVTIHKVDKGVDTGNVLYQAKIPVTRKDNFVTYPYLQFGEGLSLIKKSIDDIVADKSTSISSPSMESKLWYHPTIWQYLANRILKGKK
ncbi:MAG: formyl transferase, partial [Chitinophagaceae bacterium]